MNSKIVDPPGHVLTKQDIGFQVNALLPSRFDDVAPVIVSRLGRADFHVTLLRSLGALIDVQHISHLTYDRSGSIRYAAAASLVNQSRMEQITNLYVDRLFRRDPNYRRVRAAAASAGDRDVSLLALAAEHIPDQEYRRLMFDGPGFKSKVSLIGGLDGTSSYLNLYFSGQSPDVREISALMSGRGRLLLALARRHNELVADLPRGDDAKPAPATDEALSAREQQVAQLLRRGMTSKEVAKALNVAPSTVLTYKARLFEKLRVGNLKQFLLQSPAQL